MQRLPLNNLLGLVSTVVFLTASVSAATITGIIKGPDGAPFRGALVEARNAKTRITVMVFSDKDGRYRAESLPAGNYQVFARAIGLRSDLRGGIVLTDTQNAMLDRSLHKQPLLWSEVPIYQWFHLLPERKGKDKFIEFCGLSCHGGF